MYKGLKFIVCHIVPTFCINLLMYIAIKMYVHVLGNRKSAQNVFIIKIIGLFLQFQQKSSDIIQGVYKKTRTKRTKINATWKLATTFAFLLMQRNDLKKMLNKHS